MKAIIYTRVSSNDQSTQRQLNDMKNLKDFTVQKVFSEKISAFAKSSDERPGLQKKLLPLCLKMGLIVL